MNPSKYLNTLEILLGNKKVEVAERELDHHVAASLLWSTYVKLPHRQEAKLFRIVQSANSSSARHACAQPIHVQLSMRGDTIYLRVQDDCQGIAATRKRGYGLRVIVRAYDRTLEARP